MWLRGGVWGFPLYSEKNVLGQHKCHFSLLSQTICPPCLKCQGWSPEKSDLSLAEADNYIFFLIFFRKDSNIRDSDVLLHLPGSFLVPFGSLSLLTDPVRLATGSHRAPKMLVFLLLSFCLGGDVVCMWGYVCMVMMTPTLCYTRVVRAKTEVMVCVARFFKRLNLWSFWPPP